MVESSRVKINFIKLAPEELSAQLKLLVSSRDRVIFWKSSPRYFEGHAVGVKLDGNRILLTLERAGISIRIVNAVICLHFTLNKIDYFLRGKVLEQLEDIQQITVELETDCFKSEKRSRERLLTYPHYDVYVYLKLKKQNKQNIIFFNKKEQKTKDFFGAIDHFQKQKIALLSPELHVTNEDEEDVISFRVEDLSSRGLSFFASSDEKSTLDLVRNNCFTLVLRFETDIFTLNEARIVYEMNYINAQFLNVPMFKMGITFEYCSRLKEKIEKLSDAVISSIDYQKKFEEFIKNE